MAHTMVAFPLLCKWPTILVTLGIYFVVRNNSRLLKVYEEKNKEREKQRNGALAFRNPKEDEQA